MLAGAGSLMLAAPAVRAQGQNAGVALVIGNSKYQWEAQLPNVRRDAPDIAKVFQAMGLKTELVQDAGHAAMRQALDKFGNNSRGAPFAAFYFAGHGATWARSSYIVPVDTDLGTPSVVQTLISGATVAEAARQAGHGLMVYDACRNNPADGWRQTEAERAAVVGSPQGAPPARIVNRLTLYSTAPGRVALDGPPGDNSPFAAALLRQFDAPTVDLAGLPAQLRRDLLIATEGKQVLWDLNAIQDGFTVRGAAGKAPANRSTWANDPARIVELPNAYAFARDSRFNLPVGLIAHRSPTADRDARMIGAYKWTQDTPGGRQPHVMIVMSIEDGKRAELIMAGIAERGPFWRFVSGTIKDGKLNFVPRDTSGAMVFDWKDASSGSLTIFPASTQSTGRLQSASFTRLDG